MHLDSQNEGPILTNNYSLCLIESVVLDSVSSFLTVRFIQNFCINIIYFIMTYFLIRDTLIMI
jgi:hypothetical protein